MNKVDLQNECDRLGFENRVQREEIRRLKSLIEELEVEVSSKRFDNQRRDERIERLNGHIDGMNEMAEAIFRGFMGGKNERD